MIGKMRPYEVHLSLISIIVYFLVINRVTPVICIETSCIIFPLAHDCDCGDVYRSLDPPPVFIYLLLYFLYLFHERVFTGHATCFYTFKESYVSLMGVSVVVISGLSLPSSSASVPVPTKINYSSFVYVTS